MLVTGGGKLTDPSYLHETIISLLIGDESNRSPFWKFFLFSLIAFFAFIWQAAFIFRIMNTPHSVKFSNVITYYPVDLASQDKLKHKDYIVFRLMNNGFSTIYNVNISVMLRAYDATSKTFQHYKCSVKNCSLPVFSPYMPFRIYIETGLIYEAIDCSLLNPYSVLSEQEHSQISKNITIDYARETIKNNALAHNAFCFVVYAEGFDSELDQSKSFMKEYSFVDMKKGYFSEILPNNHSKKSNEPQVLMFSQDEIAAKFDSIEPS